MGQIRRLVRILTETESDVALCMRPLWRPRKSAPQQRKQEAKQETKQASKARKRTEGRAEEEE